MIRTFIIAEAGVNHNGDLEMARALVQAAAAAGADAVKFQTFKAADIISKKAPKGEYQKKTTDQSESQLEMIRKLELDEEAHHDLKGMAKRFGIEFMSTPFDLASVDLLKRLEVKRLKVPSGEITNALMLDRVGRAGLPVILSTGMATLEEIQAALGVLAHAMCNPATSSNPESFKRAFESHAGQAALKRNVTLLHCVSEYPAPLAEANLRAIKTLGNVFGIPVGYSDHTLGLQASIAAVACGATMIEKHFTLDKTLPGPDHQASLDAHELKELVSEIREMEIMLGTGVKSPSESEAKNIPVFRKSLVASRPIRKGDTFTSENVTTKRPGTGLSPFEYWDVIGKKAVKDFDQDDLLEL